MAAALRRLALWLAPAQASSSRRAQVSSIARQARALDPDAILFPEQWLTVPPSDREFAEEIVDDVTRPLTEAGIRCFVGAVVESGLLPSTRHSTQMLIEAAGHGHAYVKHCTAGHVAIQDPDWQPSRNLPVWHGGVGPTLCHDMYLALLAHRLTASGARLLINPSGGGVVTRKWLRVLRGRALESSLSVACTMTDRPGRGHTACWVVDAAGGLLPLMDVDGQTVTAGDRPGMLYVGDLRNAGEPLAEPEPTPAGGGGCVPLTVKRDRLRLSGESVAWGASGARLGEFDVVALNHHDAPDPCAWIAPLLQHRGKTLYWIRCPRDQAQRMVALAESKAIELCSPSVIEAEDRRPVVVELHNASKGVRVNNPPTIAPRFQFGYASALRMLQGYDEPSSAWQRHVPQYASLLWSCRA